MTRQVQYPKPHPDHIYVDALPELDAEAREAVAKVEEELAEVEAELGLERVDPARGRNRADRRETVRTIKRLTRHPRGLLRMEHPLLKTKTPFGLKRLRDRREKRDQARAARKAQQRLAAKTRRRRQKSNRRGGTT